MTDLLQADPAGIARAAALLRAGELVAFGTETVYGLGADATNDRAVAAIFAAKRTAAVQSADLPLSRRDAAFADVVADGGRERSLRHSGQDR